MTTRSFFALLLLAFVLSGQTPLTPVDSGKRPTRLVITNAMVIDGAGTPANGPRTIVIENGRIQSVSPMLAVPAATDKVIDAAGKYVMPGLINLHGHVQDERSGVAMDQAFQFNLWLASGITTVRDVGSNFDRTKLLREQSAKGAVAAPRLQLYVVFGINPGPGSETIVRERVRAIKAMGADGIKFFEISPLNMSIMQDEAHKLGLRTAHHAAVAETNAWHDMQFGTTSIEHWYGIPDAALRDGVQNFPPTFNYQYEVDRFRYAGHLWRQADPVKLKAVLDGLVKAKVAWSPTLNIYEAARDLQRYQNQPWFASYLHPALEKFFAPNPNNHGSFFLHWTTADEAEWRGNYRIWMDAVREFERLGGTLGIGEDAGFIYNIYGFGLIRALELHQEAGFHPLQVIRQATSNNARIMGMEDKIGFVRPGYLADLLVIDGNPLEDFKILYPHPGTPEAPNSGKILWTVKDGIPYHAPSLSAAARHLVEAARKNPQPSRGTSTADDAAHE